MSRLGIIAEEQNDVDVLAELAFKIVGHKRLGINSKIGRGGGRVYSKCITWSSELADSGCSGLIVCHDADDRDPKDISSELEQKAKKFAISAQLIVIPVREIESWLLSDTEALKRAFNLKIDLRKISNPESLEKPKEYLGKLVSTHSENKIFYVNSIHNRRIAAHVNIDELQKCGSFRPLRAFLESNFKK